MYLCTQVGRLRMQNRIGGGVRTLSLHSGQFLNITRSKGGHRLYKSVKFISYLKYTLVKSIHISKAVQYYGMSKNIHLSAESSDLYLYFGIIREQSLH